MQLPTRCLITLLVLLTLAATGCGGGGGGSGSTGSGGGNGDSGDSAGDDDDNDSTAAVSVAEAFQLLNQASFGPTEASVARVLDIGIEGWIDEQLQQPASLQLPYLLTFPEDADSVELQTDRVDVWYRNALHGEDQLRQRVAFALSQIMVVSQQGVLVNGVYALADYYDMLAEDAFGNYRDLIEDVTLHPAMGVYLSMLGNEKPDSARNIRPDENYARELMQLFSIGLVELNSDGSQKVDAMGLPVPTYDQSVIEGFSHVYTGWNWAGAPSFQFARPTIENQALPMQLYPDFHDTGSKKLLNGVVLPPGQSGEEDLSAALDNVFNHPNVGPFIAIRLIQRLVTSNPSPAYVARVAGVFDNDGSGVRGNLGAVVKAILMDPEARGSAPSQTGGKLKEPILRVTQLWRVYDAQSSVGGYPLVESFILFGQGPLQSPSVFNFFSPFYAPAGEIRDAGLVAPELQIATEYQNTLFTNLMLLQTFSFNQASDSLRPEDIFIDISEEMSLVDDIDALIDRVAGKLLGGEISAALRQELTGMLEILPSEPAEFRAAEAIYFIASSPEYAYQR
ncbi:MAG: DUF1800 domain-containing protein [Pseudomonadota bacterium]